MTRYAFEAIRWRYDCGDLGYFEIGINKDRTYYGTWLHDEIDIEDYVCDQVENEDICLCADNYIDLDLIGDWCAVTIKKVKYFINEYKIFEKHRKTS